MVEENWTLADLAELRAMILSGTKRVTMGGRTREFHSLTEMMALERRIAKALAPARKRRTVMVVAGRG